MLKYAEMKFLNEDWVFVFSNDLNGICQFKRGIKLIIDFGCDFNSILWKSMQKLVTMLE